MIILAFKKFFNQLCDDLKTSNNGVGYLLLTVFLDTIMTGMVATHIPLVMESNGEKSQVIGWVLGVASISTILGAPLMSSLSRRFGIGRVLIVASLANGFLILILAVSEDPVYWGAVRFITGFFIAIKWLGAEAWLNHLARTDNRGRIMTLYSTANTLGFGFGSGIISHIFLNNLFPYITMIGLSGLAVMPLLKMKNKKLYQDTTKPSAASKNHKQYNFWFAVRNNPIMLLVALSAGIMFGSSSMIAVQIIKQGFNPESAGMVIACYAIGPVLFFPLISYAVNEWSPRVIIPISGILCAIIAWPAFYSGVYSVIIIFVILYGTMEMVMYSSLLRSIGHDYRGQALITMNGAIIAVYSAASMIASPLTGQMMALFGSFGLPLLMAAVGLIGVLVLFYNRRYRY